MNLTKRAERPIFFTLVATALYLLSGAVFALEDGIYMFPETPNQYAVLLSRDNLYQGFAFSIDPEDSGWTEVSGSRTDESTVRLSSMTSGSGRVKFFEVKQTMNEQSLLQISCQELPSDNGECSYLPEEGLDFEMLMPVTGQLKGIFTTTWGARIVLFESNGVIAALFFEFGTDLSDNSIVSAYTARMDSDRRISDLVEVVAPANDDDELTFDLEWQVTNFDNPQLEFVLSNCALEEVEIDCIELEGLINPVARVF